MSSLSDILNIIQNGVTALNNLGQQFVGSFRNISGQLAVNAAAIAAIPAFPASAPISNSLGADVPLTNVALYFAGPSVAQGTTGTWWASGTVTLFSPSADDFSAQLWDGTTVIDTALATNVAGKSTAIAVSGFLASPAGNLRISVRDFTSVNGLMTFFAGGTKDCTVSAYRIA